MKVERQPGASIGAEISGVDIGGDVREDVVETILRALFEHHVVVVRAQTLTPESQIRFARRLGAVAPPEPSRGLTTHEAAHPEVQWLAHRPSDGRPSQADAWHTDYSYLPRPPELACLYGVEIPPDGPDTLYVDLRAAYDALPRETQDFYARLRGVHTQRGGLDPGVYRLPPYVVDGVAPDPDLSADRRATHPFVRTHPVTGRKSLYAAECYTVGFEGVPFAEGRRVLATMYREAVTPERTFRHVWKQGDCVLSDNTTTNHRRSKPSSSARTLSRVMVSLDGGASR